MNIIFGIWRPQGPPVTRKELESMAVHTRRFAPDGEWYRITPEIGYGVQAQYTHERSRLESQPASDAAGNVLVFDGRLDNYRNLMSELGLTGDITSDSEIILSAYRRWGKDCLVRLIGDWALVLWDARSRTLYLARDHAGTRLLHYFRDASGTLVWATYLDSYLSTASLASLDPVYIASYLGMLPCYGRTPYRDIHAVLPGHLLKVTLQSTSASQFWKPGISEPLSCRSFEAYKEEFLHLFQQSVVRRTPPGTPVLAQLSGGMDSTSVVCIADRVRNLSSATPGIKPLDTLSYFDDSDPDWNESPYFTLVEAKRGRIGFHLDISKYRGNFERAADNYAAYLYPGIDDSTIKRDLDLFTIASSGGYRSILSGIGGDEFTGGNVMPTAEIEDLLVRGRLFSSAHRAVAWCLAQRLSLCELFGQIASSVFGRLDYVHRDSKRFEIPWLTPIARQHCETAVHELPLVHFTPLSVGPKTADLSETWWYTLRTQPHFKPSNVFRWEYRYPYLDRDFLEFLMQLPYEYLAQPGRRRFLMRAALQHIVPEEILERRRKAFLLSGPLGSVRKSAPLLAGLIDRSLLIQSGYVDSIALQNALGKIVSGDDLHWWGHLYRFALMETWLQHRESNTIAPDFNQDHASVSALA
jgi:asparagine synthase (glutamine-hydrolysing)